ncbi:MAG TPA: acyltransferase [Candidatus Atribacteria bacterium]|nr:acyltransferase [Candidatus Atribacteria bacterium]HPT78173.1 acyltransferase [Candidatus Atribacteria bacterium]
MHKKLRLGLQRLWLHPKLILNFIYSLFLNLFYTFTSFFRFKIFADFGSSISKMPSARLRIDKRLYLGGRYIGDMSKAKASLLLYRGACFHAAGKVKLGPGVGIVVGNDARLTIGDNSYITANSIIFCSKEIEIGRECAISWNTTIIDTDFHHIYYPDGTTNELSKPVKIGNRVWIGSNTTILKGVTIGDNSVIGANTLVNKDVPPNCLAVGNPMRIIKEGIDWKE